MLLALLLTHPALAAIVPLVFTVNMSEPVNVVTTGGTPYIQLNIGGVSDSTKRAGYTAGTGTAALSFSYTPAPGDVDLDGITLVSPVELNGGTLSDINGNPITNRTFTLPDTSGVRIDYPSLSMDFTNGSSGRYTLNGTAYNSFSAFQTASSATFTRNSIATYFDSSGNLQTASANTPRFDHDPISHAAKGILIEESRTNLLPNSIFSGTAGPSNRPTGWSRTGGTDSANTLLPTENVLNMTTQPARIVMVGPAGYQGIQQNISLTTSTYTVSAYVRKIAGVAANDLIFYSGVGSPSTITIASAASINAQSNGEWKRYSATTTFTTAPNITSYLMTGGPVGNGFDFALPQIELGSFPTSYIPTSGSAVTRAADVFSLPAASWYNNTAQTLVTASTLGTTATGVYKIIAEGNNTRAITHSYTTTGTSAELNARSIGGTNTITTGLPALGNRNLLGVSQNTSPLFAKNGTSVNANGSTAQQIAPTSYSIGHRANPSPNLFLNGWIDMLKYYPASVSGPQLQLLTAP